MAVEHAMNSTQILFAGVPHTGKSTFLALLNLGITSGTRVSLALGNYRDDREYLNTLTAKLITCEPADRTLVGQTDGLNLSLQASDGRDIALTIPDLSGETWRDVLSERICAASLIDQIETTDGVCIFLHALDFKEDPTIAEVHRVATALGEEDLGLEPDAHQLYQDVAARSSQIDLVDLLQILGDQYATRPRRIALIVSAFDVVGKQSPQEWLSQHAPLAEQYLRSNCEALSVNIYGLSAQGGRFDDKDELKELRKRDPLGRAFLRDGEGIAVNLDAPIVWALGIE